MNPKILPVPPLRRELVNAAKDGSLVLFIGAGVSKLEGLPLWDDFANSVIREITPGALNHDEARRLYEVKDPRRRLSLALIRAKAAGIPVQPIYERILAIKDGKQKIYTLLNKFDCTIVTTNYDKYLRRESKVSTSFNKIPLSQSQLIGEEYWRISNPESLLPSALDVRNEDTFAKVIHLHGCIDDPANMVITTKDYLGHYSNINVVTFLKSLFTKTVLFIGYGLEEMEVLEYIFKNTKENGGGVERLFLLQGYYGSDRAMCAAMEEYYRSSFGVSLIPFLLDINGHHQLVDIIKDWMERLTFGAIGLSRDYALMMEELDDNK